METPAYESDTARKAFELITSADAVVTVYFIKRSTDTVRRMVCIYDPTRKLRFDPTKRQLLPVFDVEVGDYRFISLDRVLSIVISGERRRVGTFGPSDMAVEISEGFYNEGLTSTSLKHGDSIERRSKMEEIADMFSYPEEELQG